MSWRHRCWTTRSRRRVWGIACGLVVGGDPVDILNAGVQVRMRGSLLLGILMTYAWQGNPTLPVIGILQDVTNHRSPVGVQRAASQVRVITKLAAVRSSLSPAGYYRRHQIGRAVRLGGRIGGRADER